MGCVEKKFLVQIWKKSIYWFFATDVVELVVSLSVICSNTETNNVKVTVKCNVKTSRGK